MDNDLLIAIGGDISNFTKSVKQAETRYKTMIKNMGGQKVKFYDASKDFAIAFDKIEKEAEKTSKKVRNAMGKALKLDPNDDASAKRLAKYEAEFTKSVNTIQDRRLKAEQLVFFRKMKNARRIAEKEEEEAKRIQAMQTRHMEETARRREAIEARSRRRSEVLWRRHLATIRRIEAREAEASAAANTTRKDTSFGARGFFDSVKIVAKYGAISQVLYGIQNSFGGAIREAMNFNNALYANQSILDANEKQSKQLIKTVKTLGTTYGGSFDEIQEGMITIGRAGVEVGKGLATATKVVKEMALITGDTMKEGADVMSSFINVFNDTSAQQVQNLGDKMMYVANETRLSLKDFSTFSNYALVTAQSLGLTENATLSLAGAFSKVGLNASTIGTSIARLGKILIGRNRCD